MRLVWAFTPSLLQVGRCGLNGGGWAGGAGAERRGSTALGQKNVLENGLFTIRGYHFLEVPCGQLARGGSVPSDSRGHSEEIIRVRYRRNVNE